MVTKPKPGQIWIDFVEQKMASFDPQLVKYLIRFSVKGKFDPLLVQFEPDDFRVRSSSL